MPKPDLPATAQSRDLARRGFIVLCANSFVAEDAAQVIRDHDPAADIGIAVNAAEVTQMIAPMPELAAVLVVAPRLALQALPFLPDLSARGATLLVLRTDVGPIGTLGCRVLTGEVPFTGDSLRELLARLDQPGAG